jgi:nitrite reductase (NADH) small subunit
VPEVYVGKESEFGDRDRKIIAEGEIEVGVFRLDGEFYAWRNQCVHQGGPVCQGKILSKVEELIAEDKTSRGLKFSETDVHIICPWHGYEFNIRTGRHPGDRNVRLRAHEVKVRDGEVYVVV